MATNQFPTVEEILSKNASGTPGENIDRVSAASAVGQISSAIGDSIYGINHRQQPGAISINKDYYGLTFFTRPRMNLTTENVRAIRKLTPLLSTEETSIQRIIRCTLDHELCKKNIRSTFVDEQQAFIPMLTNHLLSMNGWPDVVVPFSTSQEGVYKEAFSLVDGVTDNFSTYDITANFRNIPGDPITALFLFWVHYMSEVFQGHMVPYPDMVLQNEVDYQTRIYRLVLDSSKKMVQKIGACGAAFPTNSPIGAAFNFESDRVINDSNNQISIHFQCMGAMYQDDILIDEFNRTTILFNDGLADGRRETGYVKIPIDALTIFNNRGYPRINPQTYELEWWVSTADYAERLPYYQTQQSQKGS